MAKSAQAYLSQCPVTANDSVTEAKVGNQDSLMHAPDVQKVILASVTNMTYSVDLDTLQQLFTRFGGPIEKIVSFSKNPSVFQALIQFRDAADAKKASAALHNRNMYEGCNTLQISPSKLPEIKVKANDRLKSWDFTVEPTIPGPASLPTFIGNQAQGGLPQGVGADSMQNMQFPGMQQQMLQQMQQLQQHNSTSGFGAASTDINVGGFSQNPVLICYNLEPAQMTAERLFNLMSLYGIVTKVKILREKPDTALVQFSHPGYTQLAKSALNEVPIFGRPISLAFSKNAEVKLPAPKPTDNEEELARMQKEFHQRDQRHKPDETEKFQKSSPPTTTVFVSNIPEDATKEEIFALISAAGGIADMTLTVSKNATKKQMAVLAMNSVADVSFLPSSPCLSFVHTGHLKCLLLSQLHPARQLTVNGVSQFLRSEHFLTR
eukprot:GHVN01032180.1.p1 GENE.GHVN01032180.1~~GHVN01032180.1.p1  ORF type:complete len:435 (-),score=42.32 GHVN01032180.1:36-1340(-)